MTSCFPLSSSGTSSRGLFSYGLEWCSVGFLYIYPHELFVLVRVPNSSHPTSSPRSQPVLLEAKSRHLSGHMQKAPSKGETRGAQKRWGATLSCPGQEAPAGEACPSSPSRRVSALSCAVRPETPTPPQYPDLQDPAPEPSESGLGSFSIVV